MIVVTIDEFSLLFLSLNVSLNPPESKANLKLNNPYVLTSLESIEKLMIYCIMNKIRLDRVKKHLVLHEKSIRDSF